jgi:homoserine kinase
VSGRATSVRVFAPASVGNVGPGFDVLGMAITGLGDTVEAAWARTPGVHIEEIMGDGGALPRDPDLNTAGIAAREALALAGERRGVALRILKGIPGTGLGSSAASAVAGAFAVATLLGGRPPKAALLPACVAGERHVSGGVFLDNLGASLFGGVVVCHTGLLTAWSVGGLPGLQVVVATPDVQVLTRDSRAALAATVPMAGFVHNMAAVAAMVAAAARGDAAAFGRAIDDRVVEPQRAGLIPGFVAVKAAALARGALGCSISGAGASVFAVTDRDDLAAPIGEAMQKAFVEAGVAARVTLARVDAEGARPLAS